MNKQLFLFTGYQLNSAPLTVEQKTLFYHRYIEAFKFANGLKKDIRDPQFASEKVSINKSLREYLCIDFTHAIVEFIYFI